MRINREWFFGPNFPKFGVGISKFLLRIWNQHFQDIICVLMFRQTDKIDFFDPNLARNEFWDRNFKTLSLDSKLALANYHVCQFSVETGNFEFFWCKFGEIAQSHVIFWF